MVLAHVEPLGLEGRQALGFWQKTPLSQANREVSRLFRREPFEIDLNQGLFPLTETQRCSPEMRQARREALSR